MPEILQEDPNIYFLLQIAISQEATGGKGGKPPGIACVLIRVLKYLVSHVFCNSDRLPPVWSGP